MVAVHDKPAAGAASRRHKISQQQSSMTNPLAEGFDASKSVFVTNIDIEVQEAHLKQLFGFCGELSKLKFLSHTLASPFKAVRFYFLTPAHCTLLCRD